MPNGPFTSYKRERTKKKKSSRVERRKCCRTDFGASLSVLALCFLLHSFPLQGFEEARAASRIVRVRPAAPPTCSCFVRRSEQRSASVRRPVRCLLVPSLCPIAGCNPLNTCLLVDISIYSFVAPICVVVYSCSLFVGPCPCVIFGSA